MCYWVKYVGNKLKSASAVSAHSDDTRHEDFIVAVHTAGFPALRFIAPVSIPFAACSDPSGAKWKHPLIYLQTSQTGQNRDYGTTKNPVAAVFAV